MKRAFKSYNIVVEKCESQLVFHNIYIIIWLWQPSEINAKLA